MAKTKERIIPPAKKIVTAAAKKLPKRDPTSGRILSEAEIAKKQGAKRPKKHP